MTGDLTEIVQTIFARKIIRFATVAVIATLVNYSIFFLGYKFLHVNYLVASATGFITSVILGYQLNSRWTFQTGQKSRKKMVKYYLVYLFSLLISLICLQLFVETLNLNPYVGNLLCICVTFCTNYSGTKFWVFRK